MQNHKNFHTEGFNHYYLYTHTVYYITLGELMNKHCEIAISSMVKNLLRFYCTIHDIRISTIMIHERLTNLTYTMYVRNFPFSQSNTFDC